MTNSSEMFLWRKKVCDTVFYLFSFFGFFAYIPSMLLSIKEELWSVVIADTIIYFVCIFLTFNKKINLTIKAAIGAALFHLLGVILIVTLGPKGSGSIWLFASTVIAAMLLGNKGAVIAFISNVILQVLFFFLIKRDFFSWQATSSMTSSAWIVNALNYIVLNFVIVVINSVFIAGFKSVIEKMASTRDASIIGLAKLAEYRDNDTGFHLIRLKRYCIILGKELSKNDKYKEYLTDEYISDLAISSLLHDIGKVGVPDSILLKDGPLTDEEYDIIKRHPLSGSYVIKEIEKNIEGRSLYTMGRDIALCHHEKWDGSGYPMGLSGVNIPLSARIVALVDVFDALINKRVYKDGFTFEKSIEIIRDGSGTYFDPDIVEAFLKVKDKIKPLTYQVI
ncbi:HD domain-containing protein [Thiospirochaeta perfilievii]|uniref:HD domain-containing protein n=1 Tax=Thiospirochaeta perfilievii TaxID=252967 RepID=A0A5C1QBJ6_9SPIO|nr:HD domain-containing phosphohydrolase [Thiospirochaeta perfilievii]QEN04106.1 HD domain-containing protein [Thiospirochaeta perfilievii]